MMGLVLLLIAVLIAATTRVVVWHLGKPSPP
jgi:hypothetical protein